MMKNNVLNALHLSEVSYVGYNAFDMSELTYGVSPHTHTHTHTTNKFATKGGAHWLNIRSSCKTSERGSEA